jgi:hypothetical protein
MELTLVETFIHVSELFNVSSSLNEQATADENVTTAQKLAGSDITGTVRPTCFARDNGQLDDHTKNNKCEVLPVPSAVDIRSTLSRVRRHLEAYSNG